MFYVGKVIFENWKLKWKNENFFCFFEVIIRNIKVYLREILYDSDMMDVEIILMVGGFVECEVV